MLAARPDAVGGPRPRSLGELAERLLRPAAVARVVPLLPLPVLQTAEALAALGTPVSGSALEKLLGAPCDKGPLAAALRTLGDHALVWASADGRLRMAPALHQRWPAPLGLQARLGALLSDRSSEELRQIAEVLGRAPAKAKAERLEQVLEHHRDPERVRALVDTAPDGTRKLLYERCEGGPEGLASHGPRYGDERWATDRALLVRPRFGSQAVMPAEVALALRGPGWHAPFDPLPPKPDLRPLDPADVAREAAALAAELTGHAAALLAVCARRPPAQLRGGGIGARELARLGGAAQCPEPVVRLVLACAYAGGLVARDGEAVPVTAAYDAWAAREPAEQYVHLLRAWWALGREPTRAHDADGRPLPALDTAPPVAACARLRRGLLAAAARLPATCGVRDPAAWGRVLAWHHPLAPARPQEAAPFAALVREAGLLGVLAHGGLSPLGAALHAEGADDTVRDGAPEDLSACARRLLPAAVDRARIGADLTAVVPGVPSAHLAAVLDAVATREARGTASVWRFSAASVRRALDEHRDAQAITADLAAIATGELPQPLTYLIADTARRHGRIRVARAGCVIHGVEPELLAEVAAHRRLAGLGLRPLTPTVLLSPVPLEETLAVLRAEGYAPVGEEADGSLHTERPEPRRAGPASAKPAAVPRPRRDAAARAGGRAPRPPAPELAELATRLLAAPD
ncbi:helicase-associated domain-containing protein [Streptomyces sp. XD-27]|uniref:helicase-associated domain-containing protein n=1 Tax=Streptomyces sp. XD-27 TaxID=3062779 RepID=UPI0026F47336|nr:helicase-associated domain-containing protein [Streptomyces sp. XD-27]WKX69518.1 helicase-associated domain-containing protein [Streptomyces sp. XD-27]